MPPETAYIIIGHYIICAAGLLMAAGVGFVVSTIKNHH